MSQFDRKGILSIWPDSKKHPRNIYAQSDDKHEKLLAEIIVEMKAEVATEKERLKLILKQTDKTYCPPEERIPGGQVFLSVAGYVVKPKP